MLTASYPRGGVAALCSAKLEVFSIRGAFQLLMALLCVAASGSSLLCGQLNHDILCGANRSLLGFCTSNAAPSASSPQCCSASVGVVGAICSSAVYPFSESSTWLCGTASQNLLCGNAIASGFCIGPQCSGHCTPQIDSVGVRCHSAPNAVNTTNCRWNFAGDWSLARCRDALEGTVGVCYSGQNNWCGGQQYGVYCCPLHSPLSWTRTITHSVSVHGETPSDSISITVPATESVTLPVVPTAPQTASISLPLSQSNVPTATPTIRVVVSTPTYSSTLPSRTVRPTRTRSMSLPPHFAVALSQSTLSAESVQSGPATLIATLSGVAWAREVVELSDVHFVGSQPKNPFGFSARREALLHSIATDGPAKLVFHFSRDGCFEPRNAEEKVVVPLPPMMTDPPMPMRLEFTVSSYEVTVRRHVGLWVSLAVVLLIAFACFQGSTGLPLQLILLHQHVVFVTQANCTRGRIASYMDWMTWICQPLVEPLSSTKHPQFFVLLTLIAFVVLFCGGYLILCRYQMKARNFYPHVPLFVTILFQQGASHAGWSVVFDSSETVFVRVLSATLALAMTLAALAAVWKRLPPEGFAFVAYASEEARSQFGSHWSPRRLLAKFSCILDPWRGSGGEKAMLLSLCYFSLTSAMTGIELTGVADCLFMVTGIAVLQVFLFLLLLWMNPFRCAAFTVAMLLPFTAATALLIVLATTLDCDSNASSGGLVSLAEALVIIFLICQLLAAIRAMMLAQAERKFLAAEEPAGKSDPSVDGDDAAATAEGQELTSAERVPPLPGQEVARRASIELEPRLTPQKGTSLSSPSTANRRALLGRQSASKCCISCKKYTGQVGSLCDDCFDSVDAMKALQSDFP